MRKNKGQPASPGLSPHPRRTHPQPARYHTLFSSNGSLARQTDTQEMSGAAVRCQTDDASDETAAIASNDVGMPIIGPNGSAAASASPWPRPPTACSAPLLGHAALCSDRVCRPARADVSAHGRLSPPRDTLQDTGATTNYSAFIGRQADHCPTSGTAAAADDNLPRQTAHLLAPFVPGTFRGNARLRRATADATMLASRPAASRPLRVG